MTDNSEIFRLLLLMLLVLNDRSGNCDTTSSLNTMIIISLLLGSKSDGCNDGDGVF